MHAMAELRLQARTPAMAGWHKCLAVVGEDECNG